MSIFRRREARKDKAEPQTNFNQEPPITGGNTFEIKQVLAAQDTINKNTIPKLNFNKWKNQVEEMTYNMWWILQFHANYFTNLFRVKTKDAKINELVYNCFRVHFLYGGCGIYKKGDLIMGLYENKVVLDNSGEISKIEFKHITDLMACRGIDDFKAVSRTITFSKDELEGCYARLRPTSIGFGAITTWMPFVKQQVSLLKKIFMYSYVFHRKIAYRAADISTSTAELSAFFDEDVPFYIELDGDFGTGNKFTAEGINGATNGGVVELKEYYEFFIETYYHLLGRRYNVDDKKERNITSEVDASQNNFDILHNEDRIVKEDFLNAMTKITGVEWEDIDKKEKEEKNDAKRAINEQSVGRDDGNSE